MAALQLPHDFKEFFELLNSANVRYLVVGGYAVGYYGYPRATGDLDIWVARDASNAAAIVSVLQEFGFSPGAVSPETFTSQDKVIQIGVPPVRIDILTGIPGLGFDACFDTRVVDALDGIQVNLISLADLKAGKSASGRSKDLDDLENLP